MSSYGRLDGEDAEAHIQRLQALLSQRDQELIGVQRQQCKEELPVDDDGVCGQDDAATEEKAAAAAGGGLEEAEAMLADQSQKGQNPAVRDLLAGLQSAMVYTDTPNCETNRKLWDAYAANWSADQSWVVRMHSHCDGETRPLQCIGDEWSDRVSFQEILEEWIKPHIGPTVHAAEIGSGGGRVAREVVASVQELVCFDVSAEMLKRLRSVLSAAGHSNVSYEHIAGDAEVPEKYHAHLDFVYSFDVFVHMDLHQMRRSLANIWKLLRPEGRSFISFANLLAPAGWARFARQRNYSVGGFYFVSPDIVRCLLAKTGFVTLQMSTPRPGNTYLNRDLLVLVQRPAAAA